MDKCMPSIYSIAFLCVAACQYDSIEGSKDACVVEAACLVDSNGRSTDALVVEEGGEDVWDSDAGRQFLDGGRDATGPAVDGDADASPDADICCPISRSPGCCMSYGGVREGACHEICDGMPVPSAAWHLGTDAYGCKIWIEPERDGNEICGP